MKYEISLGFSIECNGDELKHTEFTMERKKLLFFSPCKVEGIDELHLIIKRTEYAPDSSERIENQLYEDYLPYVPHDNGKFIIIIMHIRVNGFSLRSMCT